MTILSFNPIEEFQTSLEKLTHITQFNLDSNEIVEGSFYLINQFFFIYRYFLCSRSKSLSFVNKVQSSDEIDKIDKIDEILEQIKPIYTTYVESLKKFQIKENFYLYEHCLGLQDSENYLSHLMLSLLSVSDNSTQLFDSKRSIVSSLIPCQQQFLTIFELLYTSQVFSTWHQEFKQYVPIDSKEDQILKKQLVIMMKLWSDSPQDIQPSHILSLFSYFQTSHFKDNDFSHLMKFMAKCLWYINNWSDQKFSSWTQISTNCDDSVLRLIKKLTQVLKLQDQLIQSMKIISNDLGIDDELVQLLIKLSKYDPDIIKSTQKEIDHIKLAQIEKEYFVTFEKTDHSMKWNFFSELQTTSLSTLVSDLSSSSIRVLDVSKSRHNIFIKTSHSTEKIIEKVRRAVWSIINKMPNNKKVTDFDISDVVINLVPARVITSNQPTHQMQFLTSHKMYSDTKLREFMEFWSKNYQNFAFESFPHLKIHSVDQKENKMMLSLKHPSQELFADYEILYALIQKMEGGYQSYPPNCFETKQIMVYSTNSINIIYNADPSTESTNLIDVDKTEELPPKRKGWFDFF